MIFAISAVKSPLQMRDKAKLKFVMSYQGRSTTRLYLLFTTTIVTLPG
jgi:hypothetical protein